MGKGGTRSEGRHGLLDESAIPLHQLLISLSPPPPSLQEFVRLAKRLGGDPALEKQIVANGREYVRMYHSWQVERNTYGHLVRMLEGSSED